MRWFIIPLIITLFFLNTVSATAQEIDTLSTNSEVFFQQISDILQNTPSKTYQKKSEKLLERFYLRWSIGRFNKVEKDEVRSLIEKMRTRRMRTYPHLYEYIYVLTLLSESQQVPKSFIAWHAYAKKLLDEKKATGFSDFLDFSVDLLENDRFHKKNSMSWYHRKSKFHFSLDTNFLVVFKKGNLICASRKDSSIIEETAGVFNYELLQWDGESGVLPWSRFGEEVAKEIFVELNNFTLDVQQPTFTIDSVTLYYKRFFNNPILGKLTERVSSSPPNKKTAFPKFDAYFDDFELYNIFDEISFFGGAQLEGLDLYGIGTKKSKAIVKLTKSDSLYAMVKAERFRIDEDQFISSDAEFVFYFDTDSLYHPSGVINKETLIRQINKQC